jgi:hypothetical protein
MARKAQPEKNMGRKAPPQERPMSKPPPTAADLVRLDVILSREEAAAVAQALKRINRRDLGRDGLNICTAAEERGAEAAFLILAAALAAKGHDPR